MANWENKFKDNLLEVLYRPDQPRDEKGRWTSGGAGGTGDYQSPFQDPELRRQDIALNGPGGPAHQLRLPHMMYHVTSNPEQVLKEGLKGGQSRATELGEPHGVYLTNNPFDLLDVDADLSGETSEVEFEKPSIVSVMTGSPDVQQAWRLDPEIHGHDMDVGGAEQVIRNIVGARAVVSVYLQTDFPWSALYALEPGEYPRPTQFKRK